MTAEKIETISGLAVFFLGVGLLCFTFFLAYTIFANPDVLSAFTELVPSSKSERELMENLVELLGALIPGAFLWIMGSIGGKIAKIGIEMYKLKGKKPSEVS